MSLPIPSDPRVRRLLRIFLSDYFTNGMMAAVGLLLISGALHLWLGQAAAAAASVGVIVCIPPDQAAPRRGKLWRLLPSAILGLPLFAAVQALHDAPLYLGLLLVPASFMAFLAGAWGKRGLPITMSLMFAVIFSMAMHTAATRESVWFNSAFFVLGSVLYLLWATVINSVLNRRYRVLFLADTLLSLASLMRLQAQQFTPEAAAGPNGGDRLLGQILQRQATLADQLQTARDILLEAPRTPRRQQLAAILLLVLDLRDHLLSSGLDLDAFRAHPDHPQVLAVLSRALDELAQAVEHVADALLVGALPPPFERLGAELDAIRHEDYEPGAGSPAPTAGPLSLSLTHRVMNVRDDVARVVALARGSMAPDLAAVRMAWQLFVSPTTWTWKPFSVLTRWSAPPLRHAIRAALAIGSAYAVSLVLPWGTHDYWILLTIVVVLRGSLSQTLERRNKRVLGTLIGCLVSAVLLSAHLSATTLLLVLTVAQATAHAFAVRRYVVTAVAATVLGLVQAHMMHAGVSPVFDVLERVADTLLGAAFAWVFSYLLPSWERHLIPSLVQRTLRAQASHAQVALGLGQLKAIDNEPEIEWRLARRETHDSLSALVQAIQRSLSEPRAVRPPLESLERLVAHSYQLLGHLMAVKTMLVKHRSRLKLEALQQPLTSTASAIQDALIHPSPTGCTSLAEPDQGFQSSLTPPEDALAPWAIRRMELAVALSTRVREDADHVLTALRA